MKLFDRRPSLEDEILLPAEQEEQVSGMLYPSGGGGLNDGVELDGEDFFVDPVAGEWPDPKPELQLLVAIEEYSQDLQYLTQDIKKARGMSVSFAMEAQRIAPEIFTTPVNHFTKTPTATQHVASMESIGKAIMDFLKKAAAAIYRLIKRFIYWVIGKPYHPDGDNSPVDPAALKDAAQIVNVRTNNFKKASQAIASMTTSADTAYHAAVGAHFIYKDAHGVEKKFINYLEFAGYESHATGKLNHSPSVSLFLLQQKSLFRDMVENGPYTKSINRITQIMRLMTHEVGNRQKLFGQLNNAVRERKVEHISVIVEEIVKPLEIEGLQMKFIRKDLHEVWTAIVERKSPDKELAFERVLPTVARFYDNPAVVQSYGETLEQIKLIDQIAHDMEAMVKYVETIQDEEQEIARLVQRAIVSVGAMMNDILAMRGALNDYVARMTSVSVSAAMFINRAVREIAESAAKTVKLKAITSAQEKCNDEYNNFSNFARVIMK